MRVIFQEKPSLRPSMSVLVVMIPVSCGIGLALLMLFNGTWLALLGLLAPAAMGFPPLVDFLQALYRRLTTLYILTQDRLIVRHAFLSYSHRAVPLEKIQDIEVYQGLIDRLWGTGNIYVESAGEGGLVILYQVADCRKRAEEILHAAQMRIGRFSEQPLEMGKWGA